MSAAATGRIHGKVIELDAPVPDLEGQRVRIVVEPVEEPAADAVELRRAWDAWVANGPDGPISDDGQQEFP
jgi:hypothetical protein